MVFHVAFYLPSVWHVMKQFKFSWRKLAFESYTLDGVHVHPVFYFPRISFLSIGIDKALKLFAFRSLRRKKFKRQGLDFDLVYGQTIYPDGALTQSIANLLDVPYMLIMIGSDVHTYSRTNSKIRSESQRAMEGAGLVTAVSEKLKEISADVFGKNYVDHVLYTVCDHDHFKNNSLIHSKLDRFYFVGALIRNKGIVELLTAYAKIHEKCPSATLTLIGDGDRELVEDLIKEYGLESSINLKGRISDRGVLVKEINNADVFLFPSYNEGLPNVVVEAIACERAVICTDVGGVKEISDTNLAFQTVAVKQVDEIVEAVERLWDSDFEQVLEYSKQNRAQVISLFGPDNHRSSFSQMIQLLDTPKET